MNFLYKKHPKGSYEYANYKKKVDVVVMIVLFALALGIFCIGYFSTGTKANLFSVIAVLGLLPACKQVVAVIMSMRVKACDIDTKEKLDSHLGELFGMYNLYFTSYDKNFALTHLVVMDKQIICLASDKNFKEKEFIEHLSELILKEGVKDSFLKVFTDIEKYVNRLDELNNLETVKMANGEIVNLICNVTI